MLGCTVGTPHIGANLSMVPQRHLLCPQPLSPCSSSNSTSCPTPALKVHLPEMQGNAHCCGEEMLQPTA